MKLFFHQLNVTQLREETLGIQLLRSDPSNLLVGLEVTTPEISRLLDFNIDPQHTLGGGVGWLGRHTCVERTQFLLPELLSHPTKHNLHIYVLKADLDSVSAAAVLDICLGDSDFSESYDLDDPQLYERIRVVANYDRGGRRQNYYPDSAKIPRGLFLFVGGWKNSLESKVSAVRRWILSGKFDGQEDYNRIADEHFRESICRSKVEIILPRRLVFIRSLSRGACGLGYRFAPVVVALNPSYRFGLEESRLYGKRWVVGQLNNSYVNIQLLLRTLRERESGWGGSTTIIGSPQTHPSRIPKEELIDLVKEIILSKRKNF